jgi:tetratricopeptide (TPR) repeat protein
MARTLGLGWIALRLDTAHAAPPPDELTAPEDSVDEAEPTTAREWYDHGIELGNAGDFVGAAEAFLRSYELQPTSEALYNAGFAYQQAGEVITAIETYERLLIEAERNEDLARAAEASIARLMQEVGILKGIRYAPSRPPAELHVGGRRYELDDLPILLLPGSVVVEVVDEHGERARETYEIAAGEALVVDVRALLPPPVEPPDDVTINPGPSPEQLAIAQAQARRAKQLRTVTWIGLGSIGAAGVSLATFAGLAARERKAYLASTCLEYEDGVCPGGFVPGDPEAHLRAYERHRLGIGVSAGVVGGLAVGTLVVGLVSLRLDRKASRKISRLQLAPRPGGFAIRF